MNGTEVARGSKTVATCPTCGSPPETWRFWCNTAGPSGSQVKMVTCSKCRCRFVTTVPALEELTELYKGYVSFSDAKREHRPFAGKAVEARLRRIEAVFGKGRFLDVGCGRGDTVRVATRLGWDAWGCDPFLPADLENERLARLDVLRERHTKGPFHIVHLFHVLEHCADPLALLLAIRSQLLETGYMFAQFPWGASLAARVYRDRWRCLMPEHLVFYSKQSLEAVLRRAGYGKIVFARVCGVPFPFGRVRGKPRLNSSVTSAGGGADDRNQGSGFLRQVIHETRSRQTLAKTARVLMGFFGLGDCLEIVARASQAQQHADVF